MILFSLVFSLLFLFIIVMIIYNVIIKKNVNSIKDKVENRSLIIGNDQCDSYACLEENINNESVQNLYRYIFDFYSDGDELGNCLFKVGISEIIPKIVDGKSFSLNTKNSVLIPKKIKIDNRILDGTEFLDKTLNFNIDYYGKKIKYTPKVIGVYDNEDMDITKLYFSQNDIYLFDSNLSLKQLVIILYDEKKMSNFEKYLNQNNYYYNYFDDELFKELNSYKNLYGLINIYKIILIMIIIIIIMIFLIMIVNDQKFNIAIMKAVGYTDKKIKMMFLLELLLYISFIFLLIYILVLPIIVILCKKFLKIILLKILLYYLFLVSQIIIICWMGLKKIKKIQIINLLNEN